MTPPGPACSIIFGTGVTSAAPGPAQGLQLVVPGIDAARAEPAGRGAQVSEVFHDVTGVVHHAGTQARVPGPAQDHKSYGLWVSFSDPNRNSWFAQEVTTPLPGRATSALAAHDSAARSRLSLRTSGAAGKCCKRKGEQY